MPGLLEKLSAFALAGFAFWTFAAGCGGSSKEPIIGTSQGVEQTPVPATGTLAQDAAAPADAAYEEEDEELAADAQDTPLPDISTLHARTQKDPGRLGLSLDVAEKGPDLPWAVAIVNEGDEAVNLVADARLLWFEVQVPGKRKKVTCRLPSGMFPEAAEERLTIMINPGEGVIQDFDPRLYCFTTGGQQALVPGAFVTPYFGWQEATKPARQQGRRKGKPIEQSPPFVASVEREDGPKTRTAPSKDAGAAAEPKADTELKVIQGQPFALRSEYKVWTSTRLAEEQKLREKPGPLELKMVQGSDARSERNALITIRLTNRSDRAQTVYFRREFVSFEVVGPDGVVTCDPQPDDRSPDRQAFTRLRKSASLPAPSRLIELCPQGTFAKPGLYLVHGRFDAADDGSKFGLHAFVGRVVSLTPATVRIRTGDQPLLQKQPMRSVAIEQPKP
jgi:hypothetical protein